MWCSGADDPAFQRIHIGRQAPARPLHRPGRLNEAQHRIQRIATGVVGQGVALGGAQLQAQAQRGAALFQGFDDVLAGDQAFGGLPGLISMAAYIMGIVFAIGGILKIKDHVEDPGRTELKSGAIRLVIGGALFALPFIMTVMTASVGSQTQGVKVNTLNKGVFGVNP